VGLYKVRIAGKDAFFGVVNFDIELEVYRKPSLAI